MPSDAIAKAEERAKIRAIQGLSRAISKDYGVVGHIKQMVINERNPELAEAIKRLENMEREYRQRRSEALSAIQAEYNKVREKEAAALRVIEEEFSELPGLRDDVRHEQWRCGGDASVSGEADSVMRYAEIWLLQRLAEKDEAILVSNAYDAGVAYAEAWRDGWRPDYTADKGDASVS